MVFQIDGVECIFQSCECLQSDGRLELALPYDDGVPSHLGQLHQSLLVPCFVPFYFVFPKLCIGLGHFESLAVVMPVPETAIDEDACTVFSHDKVGVSRQSFMVKPVSEPLGEEVFPDDDFRLGVFRPDSRHHLVPFFLVENIHRLWNVVLNAKATVERNIDGLAL